MGKKVPFTVGNFPPQNSRGYAESQLRRDMGAIMFSKFRRWMRGQAYVVIGNEPIYFTNDVRRFLQQHPNKTNKRKVGAR